MVRRIIRGVTKQTEEEKRRKAFAKKTETDLQHIVALLRMAQDTPYNQGVFHTLLRDALMVLYPKPWDTFFKRNADHPANFMKDAHRYFMGRALDTVEFAMAPGTVYWNVFQAIEKEVKEGNHLKDSDFADKQGFLREPRQVTASDMGFDRAQVADARRANLQAWDTFIVHLREVARQRTDFTTQEITDHQRMIRSAFNAGSSLDEIMAELRTAITRRRANIRTIEQSVAEDMEAERVRQFTEGTPSRNSPDVFSQFLANVRIRMRQRLPNYNLTDPDIEQIRSRYDAGIGIDDIVRYLQRQLLPTSQPAPVTAPSRIRVSQSRRLRNNVASENRFIRDVWGMLRNDTLTGTSAERLTLIKRCFTEGYSVEDAASRVRRRFINT